MTSGIVYPENPVLHGKIEYFWYLSFGGSLLCLALSEMERTGEKINAGYPPEKYLKIKDMLCC
jgi:hypothetical protein